MKRSIFLVIYLLGLIGYAQESIPLSEYLSQLESSTNKSFYYKKQWVDTIQVRNPSQENWINSIKNALTQSGFKLFIYKENNVFIYPNRLEFERSFLLNSRIASFNAEETKRIGNLSVINDNKLYELSGTVSNESGTGIAGVNVLVDNELRSQTDLNGKYQLQLNQGNYEIAFSHVGLESERRFITFYSSGELDATLFQDARILDEVVIEGNSLNQNVGVGQVGVQMISVAKLEKLPSLSGDLDVIKGATALPGVAVSGESSSYLNVRGGGNDQTLVLMNNSTIYNPGHLLGFFSVFNGDFVSAMTLYKGNIPARYGVRSSSVLDVEMNKWATKKLNFYGGIGIANSNLGLKTKLLEDKLDLHIGGRLSYVNWLLDFIPNKDILQSSAQFGDVNLSSKYLLNDKNTLFVSSYYGQDYFRYSDKIIYKWNTFNTSLKWSRLINEDLVHETSLIRSSLNNSSEGLELNDEFIFDNGIVETALKSSISNEKFEGGVDISSYEIAIGNIEPNSSNSLVTSQSLENEHAVNVGVFGSYFFSINDKLKINPGLRFNYFMNFGPSTINIYNENAPYLPENISGQKSINSGEVAFSRKSLEPRLGLTYSLRNHSFKAGYSRLNQYLHLISNTVLINPSTVWKASDSYIPPTKIDQYSIGYQYEFKKIDTKFSIDGFYRKSVDQIDYRDGATLVLNDNLEQAILRGEGTTYGFEFLMVKNSGKLSGILSYTYSRSFIQVVDDIQNVSINSGKRYPYYSDRPHNIKTSVDYKLSKKWTLSGNFTYVSGAPVSAPLATYEIEGVIVPFFSERNAERIPDYHRLDLVVTLKSRIRKSKKNNDRWVLTLYNLYGRDNVATIFFSSENNAPAQPFKLINVGRMIPTITYKFEF